MQCKKSKAVYKLAQNFVIIFYSLKITIFPSIAPKVGILHHGVGVEAMYVVRNRRPFKYWYTERPDVYRSAVQTARVCLVLTFTVYMKYFFLSFFPCLLLLLSLSLFSLSHVSLPLLLPDFLSLPFIPSISLSFSFLFLSLSLHLTSKQTVLMTSTQTLF